MKPQFTDLWGGQICNCLPSNFL